MFKGQEYMPSFFSSFPWCLAWCSVDWILNQSWQTRGHKVHVHLSHGFVKGEKAPKTRKLWCYFQHHMGLEAQNGSWHCDRAPNQDTRVTWHVLISPPGQRNGRCCIIRYVLVAYFRVRVQSEANWARWARWVNVRSIPGRTFQKILSLCWKSVALWFIKHFKVYHRIGC